MYQNAIFGQVLKIFSIHEFYKAVKQSRNKYHTTGFKSWNLFATILFGQLAIQGTLLWIKARLFEGKNCTTYRAVFFMLTNISPMIFLKTPFVLCCLDGNSFRQSINISSQNNSIAFMLPTVLSPTELMDRMFLNDQNR